MSCKYEWYIFISDDLSGDKLLKHIENNIFKGIKGNTKSTPIKIFVDLLNNPDKYGDGIDIPEISKKP